MPGTIGFQFSFDLCLHTAHNLDPAEGKSINSLFVSSPLQKAHAIPQVTKVKSAAKDLFVELHVH